ncbi:hypothetical protein APHAL10511_005987 [Amanita phalloides]|nr:hypothetical protein APHAL10511_005987 [Amanita phalloides]
MPDNKGAQQISSADAMIFLMDQHGIRDSDDEVDISELLGKLEHADGIAKDVEGRLDDILEDLDRLLESMPGRRTFTVPTVAQTAKTQMPSMVTSSHSHFTYLIISLVL